jgi:hypothetical protein
VRAGRTSSRMFTRLGAVIALPYGFLWVSR